MSALRRQVLNPIVFWPSFRIYPLSASVMPDRPGTRSSAFLSRICKAMAVPQLLDYAISATSRLAALQRHCVCVNLDISAVKFPPSHSFSPFAVFLSPLVLGIWQEILLNHYATTKRIWLRTTSSEGPIEASRATFTMPVEQGPRTSCSAVANSTTGLLVWLLLHHSTSDTHDMPRRVASQGALEGSWYVKTRSRTDY